MLPLGIIVNVGSVAAGGLIGAGLGNRVKNDLKERMTMLFGCCAMGMGIPSVMQMKNMPAVIFSILVGTLLGMLLHLGTHITKCAVALQRGVSRIIPMQADSKEITELLVTGIILFCASGSGIYGAIVSGMTGDHSILISKSVLDFFTAVIFACSLGAVVTVVALPQFLVLMALFLLSGVIMPLASPAMIADFKGCGGILLLAVGLRMMKLKDFPVADMVLSMVMVMPVSWMWTAVTG